MNKFDTIALGFVAFIVVFVLPLCSSSFLSRETVMLILATSSASENLVCFSLLSFTLI